MQFEPTTAHTALRIKFEMTFLYIGSAVLCALFALKQLLVIVIGFAQLKEYAGPTNGHYMVQVQIFRAMAVAFFWLVASGFGFMTCLSLGGFLS